MPSASVASRLNQHPLHSAFIQVKNRLAEKGYICWIAGGAVRDFLLNRNPFDFDLVTDATTEQILKLFPEAIPVGVQFGVVKLPVTNSRGEKSEFDLATFRRESDYQDGRRPSQVDYATPPEDAERRDFTVNALFWNDQAQVVEDFVGGLADLENHKLRCVGNPEVRFTEDHLRILRLLRFKYQLRFSIEAATESAATNRLSLLDNVSGERVWQELEKLIVAMKWSEFFKDEFAKGIFSVLFPELKSWKYEDCYEERVPGYGLDIFLLILIRHSSDVARLKKHLQARLKLSNAALKRFETLANVLSTQLSGLEWAFEAEKNESIIEILEFLSKAGITDGALASEAISIYQGRPAKLVDGNDLQGKISNLEMGGTLKKIRLLQLAQPDLSKDQLLKFVLK